MDKLKRGDKIRIINTHGMSQISLEFFEDNPIVTVDETNYNFQDPLVYLQEFPDSGYFIRRFKKVNKRNLPSWF